MIFLRTGRLRRILFKRGLGQGLDALFSQTENGLPDYENDKNDVMIIKTSLIEPRKDQPRKNFNREQLQELAASISEHGIIQPIIVVKGENGYYNIIAGERRWRACKIAGITEIPAIVRDYSKEQIDEISLVENLQREDLNPIEEALGYRTLMDRYGFTQEQVSEKVGKSRSNTANMLRLLSLETEIKDELVSGRLSMGHARALLHIENGEMRIKAAAQIIESGLSVREAEDLVKHPESIGQKKKIPKKKEKSHYTELAKKLSDKYGTRVRIKGNEKGKIEIEYYSLDDLTRIIDLLEI